MDASKKIEYKKLTRREALKLAGFVLAGVALPGDIPAFISPRRNTNTSCYCPPGPFCSWTDASSSQQYSYFQSLPWFYPFNKSTPTTIAPLGENEMRITFMGSCIPPVRRAQQMMSVFVEVGWNKDTNMPLDQFVFDCGSGVCANYGAMNVGFGRMNKVFLAHLHGDHMSDLTHIYGFGPSADRKSPQYVWGPGRSGFVWYNPAYPRDPTVYGPYADGTADYCDALRKACRWHTESFSFQTTNYPGYPDPSSIQKDWGLPCLPTPVGDDVWGDAYALVPIELDWTQYGQNPGKNVAYRNSDTRVRITHFPVIHTRRGSIGYKLEWWPSPGDLWDPAKAISMIYTSDTKPEYNCVNQAINGGNGVDVFIHEMIIPAQVWAMKNEHINQLPPPNNPGVQNLTAIQNSSHSPQGSFGYLLSQINPRPRLTVATHFPVADDTVACAMKSVNEHCRVYQGNGPAPAGAARITWSFDLMAINVSKNGILEQRGYVSDYGFSPTVNLPAGTPYTPKYWAYDASYNKVGDPYAQIDTSTAIPSCENRECNYRDDGY
ncbi:MAG: MBL fold metallo-hydrolase [Thermodesulfobacteriota bacterium]